MKVYVYESQSRRNHYLIVGERDNFGKVPSDVMQQIGALVIRKELDLAADRPLIGLDVQKAMKAISEKGYYVSKIEIRFSEKPA